MAVLLSMLPSRKNLMGRCDPDAADAGGAAEAVLACSSKRYDDAVARADAGAARR